MYNLETYNFTAYKVDGCDVQVKWSGVSACNPMEADYKVRAWLSTEPNWKGWEIAKGSIGVNDAKWESRKTDPLFECGEFFDA
tara:strand:- start:181 stop:429 length:249 start_codon:yes stop_codon:yes gene_type:complete